MLRTLGLALLALLSTVGPSQASGFTEKGLSLLSYQLCNYSVTQRVQKVEAVQVSHVTYAPCGGWIPWRRCPKTVYRTRYLAVDVPESRNVTDCCEGYEQLGLYCVLPLNRSGEFASRPGVCPTVGPDTSTSSCALDADCPGLQKCCPLLGGHRCMAPVLQAPERNLTSSWYNVTVLVKMNFQELQQVDLRLLNHMRLLHSMVTSALWPMNAAVYHLHSACGDTSTTVSRLLLGLPWPVPVANVSATLDGVVKRVYEVISVQVQDVNECFYEELNTCSEKELCLNVDGSYQCVCHQEPPTSFPQKLNRTCEDGPPIRDHKILSVTSSSFHVSWSLNSTQNRTFHVQVYRGEELLRSAWTQGTTLEVAGLEAGVLYGVKTSYQACGTNVTTTLPVRTDARMFQVTVRILNRTLTETLLNRESPEHREFSQQLLHEVESSFPPALSYLYRRGKLRLQIVSLEAGSVVVKLRVTVQDPEFPVDISTLALMLPRLWMSTVFRIDQRGTLVQDWDECADGLEHDCSPAAQCINLEGSYTCRCLTARDANPSRAGRACAGDEVSPTGGALSLTTGVMAPALSTEAAALDPETLALSPSPGRPWGTPAAGQAQTLGPPPRSEGSGVVGQDRNSTGQGPTRSSFPGATEGPLNAPGRLLRNSTIEPPALPTPAEDPTGQAVWHASLPTWDTPPAALGPTEPQNADPAPSVPIPASLETLACAAQKLSGKVRIANVRYSESFCNASSKESQSFLQLFFRMVRGSLPAAMRQHLDSGGVRLEVTRVTNGSVVVDFNLLIVSDLHVQEVSAAFFAAFQNASLLEVVGGDTVIWDYDECERQEDDCEPGTTCRNTLGSFTCSCVGGTSDFPVEYSGRPCEGNTSGNTSQAPGSSLAPGPEQPPTAAETRAASVQGASAAPQGLLPKLNLTSAVRVLCEIEKVAIAVERRFLQQESIPESSLYLGHPSCNVSDSNSTHVFLVAGWSECGTLVQSNMTNTVVRTTLRNDLSPEGIIHHMKILSPIHCAFQNDLLTSSGYTPEWGVYTIIEDLHGAGSFVTEMHLFIGDSPIPRNYSVSASDDVKIEVGLYKQKSNLKVVLTECWATPSSNARDPVMFGFINNSCPIPNTHTNVIENGDSNKAQFKLKIFSFINNSIVYLHCKLRVCMESPGTTCKINCNAFRSLRSGESSATHQTSWGPLIRSDGEAPGAKPGLAPSYIVLIVVAIFALVTGAAALLIVRYQRMTGKYNFKTQSDDFSYQVFHD
ncbi:uromodulin like 1 [Rhinolophus ferrumequinum]|uniref:Uromodulin like 1 n=1 Tax=Rhinolophus ferrumequinum TaxID=59479 RepID=A0A7J8AH86_RHIFE|nr:uromodulin like 1 [Rhinolophus ferrumequinum]